MALLPTSLMLLAVAFASSSGCLAAQGPPRGTGPPAKLVAEDRTLFLVSESSRTPLKQLGPEGEFQGFGFLDSTTVFFAYPSLGAEASSILAVYSLRTKTEFDLYELGGTGESVFVVSPYEPTVALRWIHGIYLFSLKNVVAELRSGRFDHRGFEKRLVRIAKCDDACEEPVWVGPTRIRYRAWDGRSWKDVEVELSPHSKVPTN